MFSTKARNWLIVTFYQLLQRDNQLSSAVKRATHYGIHHSHSFKKNTIKNLPQTESTTDHKFERN